MKQLRGLVETFRLADGTAVPIYVDPRLCRSDALLMKGHKEPDPVAFTLPGDPPKTRTVGPAVFCGELAYVDRGWTMLWLDAYPPTPPSGPINWGLVA